MWCKLAEDTSAYDMLIPAENNRRDAKMAACLPITGHTVRRTIVYICALVCVPFTRREGMTEEPY